MYHSRHVSPEDSSRHYPDESMNMDTTAQFVISPTATPTSHDQIVASIANPVFGRVFTDHMATIR